MLSTLISFGIFIGIPLLYAGVFLIFRNSLNKSKRGFFSAILIILTFITISYLHNNFVYQKFRNLDYDASVLVSSKSDTSYYASYIEKRKLFIDLEEGSLFVDGAQKIKIKSGERLEILNLESGKRLVILN